MNQHKAFLTSILFFLSFSLLAQNKAINYQAVIMDPNPIEIPGANLTSQPLANGNVCLKFSFINVSGKIEYEESQQATTDEYGLINLLIGAGNTKMTNSSGLYQSFSAIQWDANQKTLKVSISFDNCTSYKLVSSQILNYTPYSLYADAVDYKNVRDSPTKLSQFSNDTGYLIPKDLDPVKQNIALNTQQIEANQKANTSSFLLVNQSITNLGTTVTSQAGQIKAVQKSVDSLGTKIVDHDNRLVLQNNQISLNQTVVTGQINNLTTQSSNTKSAVENLGGTYENLANKSNSVDLGAGNPSNQLYPSQIAVKTYIDQNIANLVSGTIPDATTLVSGKIQLSGDLAGTATSPIVPALAGKEITANKSLNVQADAGSDSKYPTVKAVKTYVDQATLGTALQATVDGKADKNSPIFTGTPNFPSASIAVTQGSGDNSTAIATTAFVQNMIASATIVDADASTKGKLKLTGDLAGTADSPTVPGLALKAALASPTFTGSPNLPTGTIATTQTAGNNSTAVATTQFVTAAIAAAGSGGSTPDADGATKGKLQLIGDLGGTATLPTVPGLLLKAPIESPTFTGTVGGITKTMVGLSNVDNTSDANKPISSATATALSAKAVVSEVASSLALKAPLISPTFTGTPTLPTGAIAITQSSGNNTTAIATTEFVTAAITAAGSGGSTPDADGATKGKLQLTGDLGGTASSPSIATGAITSSKIFDGTIATVDLADASVTNAKIVGVAGSKVTGDIPGSSASLTTARTIYGNSFNGTANLTQVIASTFGGTGNGFAKFSGPTTAEKTFALPDANTTILTTNAAVTVGQGGTGATTLTGLLKGNGTSAFSVATSGTDYQAPISLTTTGSGAASLTGTTLNIPTPSAGMTEVIDEYTATAGQTVFNITQTPASASKVKVYVNGIRISKNSYTVNNAEKTVTYSSSSNGSYTISLNDRIQIDYDY